MQAKEKTENDVLCIYTRIFSWKWKPHTKPIAICISFTDYITYKLIPDILSINYNSVLSKEWKNARILGEKCQLGNFCIESVPTSAKLILGIPNCSIEN